MSGVKNINISHLIAGLGLGLGLEKRPKNISVPNAFHSSLPSKSSSFINKPYD